MSIAESTTGFSRRAERAYAVLRAEIESGRFAAVDRLPSERDLAAILGMSRTTLRKAIGILVLDGRVAQRQGYGTFVIREKNRVSSLVSANAGPKPSWDGFGLTPGTDMQERGDLSQSIIVSEGLVLPHAEEAMMLDLQTEDRVWRLCRLWLGAGEKPLAYEEVSICRSAISASGADGAEHLSTVSAIQRRIRRIRISALDGAAADHLTLPENTIGLFVEERGFAADSRCVSFSRLARKAEGYDTVFIPGPPFHSGPTRSG